LSRLSTASFVALLGFSVWQLTIALRSGALDELIVTRIAFLTLLIAFVLFYDRFKLVQNARRTVGALGPTTVTMTPDFVYTKTGALEAYLRWESFARVDYYSGDIYLMVAKRLAIRIPRRAFSSQGESESAYSVIAQYHAAATVGASENSVVPQGTGTEPAVVADTVWPPSPSSKALLGSMPVVEAPMDALFATTYVYTAEDQAVAFRWQAKRRIIQSIAFLAGIYVFACVFIAVLFGNSLPGFGYIMYGIIFLLFLIFFVVRLRELTRPPAWQESKVTFETDYERLHFRYEDSNMVLHASSLHRIDVNSFAVLIWVRPQTFVALPTHAFASPRHARDFVDRLRQAKKAARP